MNGKPRTLSSKMLQTMFLFTDASFDESKGAGLGAVLVDGTGEVVAWFSLLVGLQRNRLVFGAGPTDGHRRTGDHGSRDVTSSLGA